MNNVEFVDKVAGICGVARTQVGGYANAVAEICALVKAESAPASTNIAMVPLPPSEKVIERLVQGGMSRCAAVLADQWLRQQHQ